MGRRMGKHTESEDKRMSDEKRKRGRPAKDGGSLPSQSIRATDEELAWIKIQLDLLRKDSKRISRAAE